MTGLTKVTVVGVCGITCSGKTSLARMLTDYYKSFKKTNSQCSGDSCDSQFVYNVETIFMDDYFLPEKDPRHVFIPELSHINWELMTSLDIDKMVFCTKSAIERLKASSKHGMLILEGFLLLNCERIKSLCDLKFFIDLDYDTCLLRRSARDYDPPDVPGYFEKIVWPESQMNKNSLVQSTPDLIILDGAQPLDSTFEKLKEYIENSLSS